MLQKCSSNAKIKFTQVQTCSNHAATSTMIKSAVGRQVQPAGEGCQGKKISTTTWALRGKSLQDSFVRVQYQATHTSTLRNLKESADVHRSNYQGWYRHTFIKAAYLHPLLDSIVGPPISLAINIANYSTWLGKCKWVDRLLSNLERRKEKRSSKISHYYYAINSQHQVIVLANSRHCGC